MGNCFHTAQGRRGVDTKKSAVPEEEEEVTPPVKEVKIRITRKQLEDLLRRLDQEDGCSGAVISELLCMTSSSNFRHRGQTAQWTPALQSIPE
ncbi:hypothetical protein CFC21_023055 [Triticum aestivum]|uniref:Uncharacterized protein n=3 Tax=Triticum TaxID=4564 RepID=A0A9R1PL20_TRITD|nr:uncharacterized protein LOC119367668 [Triticum dicoccoides]XP_044319808.1 uncharacterized protein LOC123041185 [Triticum aestivum]KAF7008252.1 hypothetical protein CFC21_023055 [Triticum aestivum]VAH45343.1 unnamed protein product [Triticum turgidum subsp. durum]